jgi:hypothetical protein
MPGVRVFDVSDPVRPTEIKSQRGRPRVAASPPAAPPAETGYVGRHRGPAVTDADVDDADDDDEDDEGADDPAEGPGQGGRSTPGTGQPYRGGRRMRDVG